MQIKEMLSQHRRDFTATLECQHCGAEEKLSNGYDDDFYHQNVIPAMKCSECGKTGGEYTPRATKYHASEVV